MYSKLDAHARPSPKIQSFYKKYQNQNFDSSDPSLDFNKSNIDASFKHIDDLDAGHLNVAFQTFTGEFEEHHTHGQLPVSIFESTTIPGSYLVIFNLPA